MKNTKDMSSEPGSGMRIGGGEGEEENRRPQDNLEDYSPAKAALSTRMR